MGKKEEAAFNDPCRLYTYSEENGWELEPIALPFIEPTGLRARGPDLCVFSRGDLHLYDTGSCTWRQVPEEEYNEGRDQYLDRLGHAAGPNTMLSVKWGRTDMDSKWSEWHY
ncbi:hypothetical protein KIPB_002057 [Kipferlia bialata]|uniref:Uncharacterized protein n=1 Tax=Kipferlia bialata TaxID=797122 RepID=A0A391NPG7_9EUKA|nr:hypothetical protein KIPB_002057 [Kipferlia bialata]|eukprot:g2057.t1